MTKDKDAQQEVLQAIENLMRVATRHKVVVCGFAFGAEPPLLSNFGNCTDAGDIRLYTRLVLMCEEKRAKGQAQNLTVGEVN